MDMALKLLNGIAEMGNSHIKFLHRLLLSLYPMTVDEPMAHIQVPAPPPDPFTAFMVQSDGYIVNPGIFSAVDGLLFQEGGAGDERIWEEGFEFFDVNMDFDWTQWRG